MDCVEEEDEGRKGTKIKEGKEGERGRGDYGSIFNNESGDG